MAEVSAFSTAGEDAITRTIEVDASEVPEHLSQEDFDAFYDIERTVDEILKGDYKRISLQFPDELLRDSVPIYRALQSRVGAGRALYVLADTSYGSCCVDEVAAQHVDADAVVHYGHACMSQTYRLPVIYVFGKKDVDVDHCVSTIAETLRQGEASSTRKSPVVFRHDVAYVHKADKIVQRLREELRPSCVEVLYAEIPKLLYPAAGPAPSTADQPQEPIPLPDSTNTDNIATDAPTVFYLGGESLGLTNLLMTHSFSEVYSYDPSTRRARLESARTNRLLMRRYALVQKARDADVFGILVGTLGVASYLPLIAHIRALLSRARKKSYTISVGKLNPSKLANFLEIECWVLIACPENSVVEAKEFLKPIITPYELEVALQAEQSWTGRYVLDFEKLLAEHAHDDPSETAADAERDPDEPSFSLITGKYRHAKRYGDDAEEKLDEEPGSSAMVLRNSDGTVAKVLSSAAGQFLQERTYQGLETRVGLDAPGVLEQGRSGIAKGYQEQT